MKTLSSLVAAAGARFVQKTAARWKDGPLTHSPNRRPMAAGLLMGVLAAAVVAAAGLAQTGQGPSSSESPYLVPVAPGVWLTSILTVGDTPTNDPNYRMVGFPDGLGAFLNPRWRDEADDRATAGELGKRRRTFTLLSNHELVTAVGRVRDHGAMGAFVSMWTIDARTLEVVEGQDLIQWIRTNPDGDQVWNPAAKGIAISRLCSADLPPPSALHNERSGRGYRGRIFFSGEESGTEGRPFAHVLDGTSWEVPHLGNMAYENILLNPATGDKTIAIVTDDGPGAQVYTYVGTKRRTGNPVQRAGLANGLLYGIKVAGGMPQEPEALLAQEPIRFELAEILAAAQKTGAQIETDSDAAEVTHFLRPEDGSWDPRHPRDFYFVTTDNYDSTKPDGASVPGGTSGYSRLWRLHFDDLRHLETGGTITPLLDGRAEPVQMLDNMTVSPTGHILLQEDPGNQTRSARIWLYTIATDTLTLLAKHDPQRFGDTGQPPVAAPATTDEESSGIIPAFDILGPGWFLLDVQAHIAPRPPFTALQPELVEDGQYLAMYVPQTDWRRHDGHDEDDEDDEDEDEDDDASGPLGRN